MQEPQPLGHYLSGKNIDARRVTTRPSETGKKAKLDRVIANAEDDRDRRRCSFSCARRHGAGRGNDGHLSANQIGHQSRQAIVLTFYPVVLDGHVLALDVAGFTKPLAERAHTVR
jgi:hypothetical protein